jgi:hypothetical protein
VSQGGFVKKKEKKKKKRKKREIFTIFHRKASMPRRISGLRLLKNRQARLLRACSWVLHYGFSNSCWSWKEAPAGIFFTGPVLFFPAPVHRMYI